jgi:hypothetical protein
MEPLSCAANFCILGCFVESTNTGRRFVYCENCETAFHRQNYGDGATIHHKTTKPSGLSAAMSMKLSNPVSRPSLALEAQQVALRNLGIHSQLLGHAVYCNASHCGYSTCALIKVS